MGISLLSLWLTLLWYPWPCSLKTKMFKSKSNLKHFINLLHFFLKNYFFCRKSISEPADGPWLKSIFFYSNGFLFWLRTKIMEHLSVLADIYSIYSKTWIYERDKNISSITSSSLSDSIFFGFGAFFSNSIGVLEPFRSLPIYSLPVKIGCQS